MTQTPRLNRITVFPVKLLPGSAPERTRLVAGGALERDREFAVVDDEGDYVNGERTDAVNGLDVAFDPAADECGLARDGRATRSPPATPDASPCPTSARTRRRG